MSVVAEYNVYEGGYWTPNALLLENTDEKNPHLHLSLTVLSTLWNYKEKNTEDEWGLRLLCCPPILIQKINYTLLNTSICKKQSETVFSCSVFLILTALFAYRILYRGGSQYISINNYPGLSRIGTVQAQSMVAAYSKKYDYTKSGSRNAIWIPQMTLGINCRPRRLQWHFKVSFEMDFVVVVIISIYYACRPNSIDAAINIWLTTSQWYKENFAILKFLQHELVFLYFFWLTLS